MIVYLGCLVQRSQQHVLVADIFKLSLENYIFEESRMNREIIVARLNCDNDIIGRYRYVFIASLKVFHVQYSAKYILGILSPTPVSWSLVLY